jgi:hypothetical protein
MKKHIVVINFLDLNHIAQMPLKGVRYSGEENINDAFAKMNEFSKVTKLLKKHLEIQNQQFTEVGNALIDYSRDKDNFTLENLAKELHHVSCLEEESLIIIINAHGEIENDEHVIVSGYATGNVFDKYNGCNGPTLDTYRIPTKEIFSLITKFFPSNTLEVIINSCYGRKSIDNIDYLPDGAMLISLDSQEKITFTNSLTKAVQSIVDNKEAVSSYDIVNNLITNVGKDYQNSPDAWKDCKHIPDFKIKGYPKSFMEAFNLLPLKEEDNFLDVKNTYVKYLKETNSLGNVFDIKIYDEKQDIENVSTMGDYTEANFLE